MLKTDDLMKDRQNQLNLRFFRNFKQVLIILDVKKK